MKLPIKVKKRRPIAATEDSQVVVDVDPDAEGDVDMTGWEEFYDYVFPDDEKSG